jgi:hypothetical protein
MVEGAWRGRRAIPSTPLAPPVLLAKGALLQSAGGFRGPRRPGGLPHKDSVIQALLRTTCGRKS